MRDARLNIAHHSPSARHSLRLVLLTVLILMAMSCDRNHDGNLDSTYETQLTDIVTYTGQDADDHATFRLEGRDDEPGVDLFTTVARPDKVALNSRVLLYYSIAHKASDGKSWNINARALTRIMSDSLRVNNQPLGNYSMRPIKLISAWRTGEFINLHGQVEYTGKNRHLYMLIDHDTRNKPTADAYLIHDLLGTPEDSVYYWRDFYLSVNVGVLKKPQSPTTTLRLHINNAATPDIDHIDFKLK